MPKAKRVRRSRIVHWLEIEDVLDRWILEQREKVLPVSTIKICLQAKKISANMGISNFNCSLNWCDRFMAMKKLSVRTK